MALNYDFSGIDSKHTMIEVKSGDKSEQYTNPITEALIWTCMFIGMNKITKDNVDEFWYRTLMLIDLDMHVHPNNQGRDVGISVSPWALTKEDIINHIGLSTNVSEISRKKFHNEIIRMRAEGLRHKIESGYPVNDPDKFKKARKEALNEYKSHLKENLNGSKRNR